MSKIWALECGLVSLITSLLTCTRSGSGIISVLAFIREYASTLYVGLALAVSPTNTNFRLTFLLTRLQKALYEDLAV